MQTVQNDRLAGFARQMMQCNALAFRDVEGGQLPFRYSSGNLGPGYLMIKGLVTQRRLLTALTYELAVNIRDVFPDIDYVAGNATGGMIGGWIMAEALSNLLGREVPYFYVRGTRKAGGHGETITGDTNNDFFKPGRKGLVFEELVNFAQTTTNSAIEQRRAGYTVNHAATLVFYDHHNAHETLKEYGITLHHLFTVERLLGFAKEFGFDERLIQDYRDFLHDPAAWRKKHGIVVAAT